MKALKILLLVMLLNACRQQPAPGHSKEEGGKGYLALGDSYTIGESVSESERWPVLLANALNKDSAKVKPPHIIATTGWTTGDLLLALKNYDPAEKFGMVSLLIGVNNQYQGRSEEEYREEFARLLNKATGYAEGGARNVFVLSIPDWGVTPYGAGRRDEIAAEIDRFNQIAREECGKQQILFIDITALSREALNDPALIAGDHLHFSGKMYARWAGLVLTKIGHIN